MGTKTRLYDVRNRRTQEEWRVRATSHEHAATIVAKRITGTRKLLAHRLTGASDASGIFQAFEPWKGGLTSRGPELHVWEA